MSLTLSFPASQQEDPRFETWWSQVLSAQGKMRSHALLVLVFGSAWCSGLRFPSDTCVAVNTSIQVFFYLTGTTEE